MIIGSVCRYGGLCPTTRHFNTDRVLHFNPCSVLCNYTMRVAGKVVLVTGGSSEIGAATAILFANEGASVAIVGRNEEKLKNVAAKCGPMVLVIKNDITDEREVRKIIRKTLDAFGRIDVLINNAVLARLGSFTDRNILYAYDDTMNVNVRSVINMMMNALPLLKASKGNIINVNISSVAGLSVKATPEWVPYSISKAALNHLTKSAARELAPFGVRVNAVAPGPVSTNFFDNNGVAATSENLADMCAIKRVSTPEEIAHMILYLAGEHSVGITGSIQVVENDNGFLLEN